jgi:repressor LexA
MKKLTVRQQEIVSFIRCHIEKKSYPPTLREIAEHFSISVRGVHDHVMALKKKGALTHQLGTARTIELTCEQPVTKDSIDVPLLKNMAEQTFSRLFLDDSRETMAVPSQLLSGENECFLMRMTQASLPELGLLEGDFLLFKVTSVAEDQRVVLVLLQDSYCVRQYFNEGHRIRLGLGSSLVNACYVDQAIVAGVLVGMMRVYEK